MSGDAELEEHDERLRDRLMGAEFAVLNTIDTVAGLFISVASLLASLSPHVPRWFFVVIVCLCSITLLCVLLDFRFYRRAYDRMAFTPKRLLEDTAVAEAYSQHLETLKFQVRGERRWKRRRERACYISLVITVLLLLFIVVRY